MFDEVIEDGADFQPEWRPIAEYDMVSHPNALLRDGSRQMFGYFGKPDFITDAKGEMHVNTVGALGWGELVDGEFKPRTGFEPSEFALVPDNLTSAFAG